MNIIAAVEKSQPDNGIKQYLQDCERFLFSSSSAIVLKYEKWFKSYNQRLLEV